MRCVPVLASLTALLLVAGHLHVAEAQETIIYGSLGDDDSAPVIVKRKKKGKQYANAFTLRTLPKSDRYTKQIVPFNRNLAPGSILVETAQRRLYFVLPGQKAILYPVGVGREGFQWSGRNRISRKAEWPGWTPPPAMVKRELKKGRRLPAHMPGGTDNPLGARALYLGSTEFRIHGTTQPWSIGTASSSGCIRMLNEHVIDLYNRTAIGAVVVVE
jgi:lipoprotein-anchoring transpeptidase ErfK/SrfK